MLKQKLIPTPLFDRAQAPPVKIVPIRTPGRFSTIVLALRLLGFGLGVVWRRSVR